MYEPREENKCSDVLSSDTGLKAKTFLMKNKCKEMCHLAVLDGVVLIHSYLKSLKSPQAAGDTSQPF